MMPRLSPKERVSRRYKEHIDSLTEGEHSHEHPPSSFPTRQERVAAGGVLCYILRCVCGHSLKKTSVYKGYKQDKIEMRGDRAEMSDFPLYLNTVAGGLDRRDQTIGGFSFVVKIYAVPVVEIIG